MDFFVRRQKRIGWEPLSHPTSDTAHNRPVCSPFDGFERIIDGLILSPTPAARQRIISHSVNERHITVI